MSDDRQPRRMRLAPALLVIIGSLSAFVPSAIFGLGGLIIGVSHEPTVDEAIWRMLTVVQFVPLVGLVALAAAIGLHNGERWGTALAGVVAGLLLASPVVAAIPPDPVEGRGVVLGAIAHHLFLLPEVPLPTAALNVAVGAIVAWSLLTGRHVVGLAGSVEAGDHPDRRGHPRRNATVAVLLVALGVNALGPLVAWAAGLFDRAPDTPPWNPVAGLAVAIPSVVACLLALASASAVRRRSRSAALLVPATAATTGGWVAAWIFVLVAVIVSRVVSSEPGPGHNENEVGDAEIAVIPDAPFGPRTGETAIWTGRELIVWGGTSRAGDLPAEGAAYDPALESWRRIPDAPIGSRAGHIAAWTGREMIVWGGGAPVGGAYDPTSDRWRRLPGAPIRSAAVGLATWTGTELVVIAGGDDEPTGAASYDPAADAWSLLDAGVLGPARPVGSVFTGDAVIVLSAPVDGDGRMTGGAFDLATRSWRAIATAPFHGVDEAMAVGWDGSRVIAHGPGGSTVGGAYDPVADSWLSFEGAPPEIGGPVSSTGIWTGDDLLFVSLDPALGIAFDPALDDWHVWKLPIDECRSAPRLTWTGSEVIIWGGGSCDAAEGFNNGYSYRPGPEAEHLVDTTGG